MLFRKELMIFLVSISTISSQTLNIKNIKVENKYPVKVIGDESDSLILADPMDFCYKGGKIYIADIGDHNIKILGDGSKLIKEFGRYGQGPEEFGLIKGIDVDNNGYIIVDEMQRVQLLDKDGHYVKGMKISLGSLVSSVKFGWKGLIYINNAKEGYLFTVYDRNFNVLKRFGDIYCIGSP